MSLTRSIAHNTIIQISGKAAGLFFSVLSIGILTRYLGPKEFGYYTTAFAFLQIFGILIDFGLQMITVQMISDANEDENRMFNNIFTLRLVSCAIFFIAPFISLLFPYPAEVKMGIAITSFTYLFSSLGTIVIGLFQKHMDMKRVAIADFASKFLFFLCAYLIVKIHLGILGVFFFAALANAVNFFILIYYAKKIAKIRLLFEKNIWLKIFSRSWPIALSIALNLIYFKADTLILSLVKSQEEVGLYGAAYKILEVLIALSYMFLGLLLPVMTQAYTENNMERFKNIIRHGFDSMVIIALPMIFITFFLGNGIMVLIAGQNFLVSGDILKILIIACSAIFIAAVFGYAIVAINIQKRMIPFYVINAILSLGAYIILIPRYSYWAAAWITVLSEIFILISALYILYKYAHYIPQYFIVLKSLAACGIMGLVLLSIPRAHILIAFPLGCLAYGIALFLFKGISKETIQEIIKIK